MTSEDLKAERATSKLNLLQLTEIFDGGEDITKQRRRMGESITYIAVRCNYSLQPCTPLTELVTCVGDLDCHDSESAPYFGGANPHKLHSDSNCHVICTSLAMFEETVRMCQCNSRSK